MVVSIIKRFLVTNDIFEFNLKILFLAGLWPNENVSANKSKLNTIYVGVLNALMIIYFIITGVKISRSDDILKFFSDVDFSLCSYNYFIKVVYFVARREKLKLLIDDINKSGDRVTDKNKDNMIALLVTIFSLSLFVSSFFILASVYNNKMCIDMWLPFDPYKNKMNLMLAVQVLTVIYPVPFVFRAIAMHGMICSLLIYIIDQLNDLQRRIRKMKLTQENETKMRHEIKCIIKKHIRLMSYSTAIKNIFKEYFLVQNLAVTLELCMNAVLVTTVTLDQASVVFGFIVYLGLALINAFIYCYLGDLLIEESKDISQAAYDSDWMSWPVDLQKNILLMITVAQRPFQLSAGGMDVINMQNFATALYNGYTIFAVLSDAVD